MKKYKTLLNSELRAGLYLLFEPKSVAYSNGGQFVAEDGHWCHFN